jgi:uncharacterized cupin superfamily protein
MPKLDLGAIEQTNRTGYPMPYAADMARRHFRRLGKAGGLSDFGVSHVVLEPGGISSQRHWHDGLDEFVVILEGEAVLVVEDGESVMGAGDCAVFPKNVPNGHHLVNRSDRNCTFLAVGGPEAGDCHYPDIDLHLDGTSFTFTRKNGEPYA